MLAGVWVASRRVRHETWQATTKGVVGTFLCPIVWTTEVACLVAPTRNRARAFVLTAAGATAGIATLAWWDRFDDRRGRPRPGAGGDHDRALDDAARAARRCVTWWQAPGRADPPARRLIRRFDVLTARR